MNVVRRLAFAAVVALTCTAVSGQQADTTPLRIVVPFRRRLDDRRDRAPRGAKAPGDRHADRDRRQPARAPPGIIGTAAVAKAKPDGKTILLQANGLSTMPAIRADLPYDTLKELAPLTLVGYAPYAWIVPADSPTTR
jgi:tripartite-type tricarboxylate transporter receptor subunit TctC